MVVRTTQRYLGYSIGGNGQLLLFQLFFGPGQGSLLISFPYFSHILGFHDGTTISPGIAFSLFLQSQLDVANLSDTGAGDIGCGEDKLIGALFQSKHAHIHRLEILDQ